MRAPEKRLCAGDRRRALEARTRSGWLRRRASRGVASVWLRGARGRARRGRNRRTALFRAAQGGGLNGSADRHDLVGVDVGAQRLFEELLDTALYERNARRAANHEHAVEIVGRQARDAERLATHVEGAIDNGRGHALELAASHRELKIDGLATGTVADLADCHARFAIDRQLMLDDFR